MFLQIDEFLTGEEVRTLAELARKTRFIDGRHSNPHNVTKKSAICDPADPSGQQASKIALGAFNRSESARNFVFPRQVALPQLVLYGAGMTYGTHIDAAFLQSGQQLLRSDVSCTMFISDPGSYQGGELMITFGTEVLRIKGRAGTAIFYPSTTLHQVTPVLSGERLVMITFIESQIADQMQRDLLYTLGEVRALESLKMEWNNRVHLDYVIQNLHRMWAT
jgi:PKHD-type hydroxylase